MSTPPSFVAEYESVWNTSTSPKSLSVTTAVGDVLAVYALTQTQFVVNTPTGGTNLTWTLQRSVAASSYCSLYIWTATATTAETFTLSVSSAASGHWGFNCLRFSASGGIGASAVANVTNGAPTLSLTTTQPNSVIVVVSGDWVPLDGASRVWLTNWGAFTEKTYLFDTGAYTAYGGYHADSGVVGTKNVGLSAPTGQTYSIAAVEILAAVVPVSIGTTPDAAVVSFPALPRNLCTDIYVNGGWVDISNDRLDRDDVVIARGSRNESPSMTPAKFELTLRNSSDNYSPANPVGAYWGSFDLNTPIRHAITLAVDEFDRSLASGWATATSGQGYSLVGAGGTPSAPDFSVDGANGTVTVPVANAYRLAYLHTVAYRDVEVTVTGSVGLNDVTGANVEPGNVVLRGQSITDYYFARVAITTAEAIVVSFEHADGTVLAGPVTVAGLTQTAALVLAVKAQAEGYTLRVKMWDSTKPEPYDWNLTTTSSRILVAGWIGLRSGLATGNTNAPLTFSYPRMVVRSPRFAGELAEIPENWDPADVDMHVPIQAEGPLRRLAQGASPLRSAMYRFITRTANPVDYWPLEDDPGSTLFANAVAGRQPMRITPGSAAITPTFASDSGFASSASLPAGPNTTVWTGTIGPYTPTTAIQIMLMVSFPAAGAPELNNLNLLRLVTNGSNATIYNLRYTSSDGALVVRVLNAAGTVLLDDSGSGGTGSMHGKRKLIILRIFYNGSNTEVHRGYIDQDTDPAGVYRPVSLANVVSGTPGSALRVMINPDQVITSAVVVGHVTFQSATSAAGLTSIETMRDPFNAHARETAGRRMERLCAQESVPFAARGNLDATEPMGYQRPATLLTLLAECAATDVGTLYELRGVYGLGYRTRGSLYNQTPTVTLAYANVAPPFRPVRDDQSVRNDITVKRSGGSSFNLTQTTGPRAVSRVGRYDTTVTVNAATDLRLPDLAGWAQLLGTVAETRYRIVRMDLTNPAISGNPALAAAILDCDVDDFLQITSTRAKHAPDPISQLARGFIETLNDFVHIVSVNCVPESPYEVIVLDTPGHKIDSGSSTLTGGVYSTTATSLSVASSATNELWTTNPAHFPIDVGIAGEKVRVTAISGTSSPQTFTVIRSINGVVKQLPNGAPVALWRRATIPL